MPAAAAHRRVLLRDGILVGMGRGQREREREGAEQAKERGVRRRREVMGVGRAT